MSNYLTQGLGLGVCVGGETVGRATPRGFPLSTSLPPIPSRILMGMTTVGPFDFTIAVVCLFIVDGKGLLSAIVEQIVKDLNPIPITVVVSFLYEVTSLFFIYSSFSFLFFLPTLSSIASLTYLRYTYAAGIDKQKLLKYS